MRFGFFSSIFQDIVGYLKDDKKPVHIGDILDTGTIVYTYNCLQFICSNIGLDMKNSTNCQRTKFFFFFLLIKILF